MVDEAIKSQCKHSWYLTDELVVLAMFDDSVDFQEKEQMAKV